MRAVFDQGDVVSVPLDPALGSEQRGTRPALVLTARDFNRLGDVLVAPITQGGDYARYAGFAVTLAGSGCRTQGVALVNKIRMLDLAARKKLMGGHARVGRKYAGRVTQLISGSTGLDDWEWGVTLVAHQLDALKEIVYEMRFDEVSARYGEFGEFYTNLRLEPAALMDYLKL